MSSILKYILKLYLTSQYHIAFWYLQCLPCYRHACAAAAHLGVTCCPVGTGLGRTPNRSSCTFPEQAELPTASPQPLLSSPRTRPMGTQCLPVWTPHPAPRWSLVLPLPSEELSFLSFPQFSFLPPFLQVIFTGFLLLFPPSCVPSFQKEVELTRVAYFTVLRPHSFCCFVLHQRGKENTCSMPFVFSFSQRKSGLLVYQLPKDQMKVMTVCCCWSQKGMVSGHLFYPPTNF